MRFLVKRIKILSILLALTVATPLFASGLIGGYFWFGGESLQSEEKETSISLASLGTDLSGMQYVNKSNTLGIEYYLGLGISTGGDYEIYNKHINTGGNLESLLKGGILAHFAIPQNSSGQFKSYIFLSAGYGFTNIRFSDYDDNRNRYKVSMIETKIGWGGIENNECMIFYLSLGFPYRFSYETTLENNDITGKFPVDSGIMIKVGISALYPY